MEHFKDSLADPTSAAARVSPVLRMLLQTDADPTAGSFVRFAEDAGMDRASFMTACTAVGVPGLFTDAVVTTDALYEDLVARTAGAHPRVVCIAGLGLFAQGPTWFAADALLRQLGTGAPVASPSSGAPAGRLSGRIAIVTGSAQGFGDGIAREMVAQGASMVIADLNGELAGANADSLNETYGPGTAIAVKVDVSDEASVQAMVERTVVEFGGLDIFVSNAGVLKAGGLEEMTLSAFEFVTKVNYTAYFLCTKHAARPMKLQRQFAPDRFADIIQINSKSGLEGSNKNFAYAGGKFGGIGLTQSFAKELVEYGIKVNSVCPGNFFEGPLWSDPKNGLFQQYLAAGKVPGAKTVEEVKRFYEAKVPMNRGCTPKDVARAIFYIVEQEYETGQAVPVTGGQNMLK